MANLSDLLARISTMGLTYTAELAAGGRRGWAGDGLFAIVRGWHFECRYISKTIRPVAHKKNGQYPHCVEPGLFLLICKIDREYNGVLYPSILYAPLRMELILTISAVVLFTRN